MKYYLAIDLGASSGRHVVGYSKNGKIILDEIYRFDTLMDNSSSGLVWDIKRILNEIINGIKLAFKKYKIIESLSIDTWGVDYVLMNGDKEIPPFYAYRNDRCIKSAEKLHKIVHFKDIYQITGIQYAPFNTLYQLFDDKQKGRLDNATDYLMMPNYFTYKLSGIKTHEYTVESTGSFINAYNNNYDFSLINRLNLPKNLFKEIYKPGLIVGDLLPGIQEKVNGNCKVVLCASHDTASAFEAIDIDDESIILSSGTWSLLGIKTNNPIISSLSMKSNYTNEGGVGYIRFLKNIMGMWIANSVKKEVNYTQKFIDNHINQVVYKETFDANDPSLLAPKSMKNAILNLLKLSPPKNDLELFEAIYHSMAIAYKSAIEELEEITNKKYKKLYIVGGGAYNQHLNKLIEECTKLEVIAMPIEATSLGNIKVQMKANKNYEKRS